MSGPCCCPNFLISLGPLLLLLILLLLHILMKNISVTDLTSCSIYPDCSSPAPWRRSFKRKSHKHLGSFDFSSSSTKLCGAPACVSLFSPNPTWATVSRSTCMVLRVNVYLTLGWMLGTWCPCSDLWYNCPHMLYFLAFYFAGNGLPWKLLPLRSSLFPSLCFSDGHHLN